MDIVTTATTSVGDPRAHPVASGSAVIAGLEGTRRPRRALLFYYLLQSLAAGPGVLVLFPMKYFRFRTLRYVFDADGMTMRWGILFRREVSLTYARIQDIHLVSNLIERWLGLGRIQVQTASGNAAAEMTIEGLPDFEVVRNELYARMRGARDTLPSRVAADLQPRAMAARSAPTVASADMNAVATALNDAVTELRALREAIERNR